MIHLTRSPSQQIHLHTHAPLIIHAIIPRRSLLTPICTFKRTLFTYSFTQLPSPSPPLPSTQNPGNSVHYAQTPSVCAIEWITTGCAKPAVKLQITYFCSLTPHREKSTTHRKGGNKNEKNRTTHWSSFSWRSSVHKQPLAAVFRQGFAALRSIGMTNQHVGRFSAM
jgi:hypothetical protein